ncbi:polysaccharide biosynthesis/export family protein [Flavobacterium sp.]|uniref:polysaccharide biosynthesis/export family protein n=1 Tax=Flavobacterium sp. TaxID=239 RepID=UPI0038FC6E66
MIYYQNIANINNIELTNSYEIKIQPDDLLMINVTCDDLEISKPFNINNGIQSGGANQQNSSIYLVDVNGFVNFPVLGSLKIGGLTRTELMKTLTNKVSQYIKNPLIVVTIKNYKVTVQGEVGSPGIYTFDTERFTLVDALIKAGDLKIQAKRNNILIIRQTDGIVTYNKVDITKTDFINSPFYYLRQNDMVYVQPNRMAIQGYANGRPTTLAYSILGGIITYFVLTSVKK